MRGARFCVALRGALWVSLWLCGGLCVCLCVVLLVLCVCVCVCLCVELSICVCVSERVLL